MAGEKELGRACYEAFSGVGAPPYDALSDGERERWDAAGEAAGEEFMRQEGFAFDPLSYQWRRGAIGAQAIRPRITGA